VQLLKRAAIVGTLSASNKAARARWIVARDTYQRSYGITHATLEETFVSHVDPAFLVSATVAERKSASAFDALRPRSCQRPVKPVLMFDGFYWSNADFHHHRSDTEAGRRFATVKPTITSTAEHHTESSVSTRVHCGWSERAFSQRNVGDFP